MKISVVIIALNEAEYILPCLLSAKQQPGDLEIILADGGSTDGTRELARPHATIVTSRRDRAAQMNTGAQQATGEVLLFLHADSCLPPNAVPALQQALDDDRVVGGTFRLRFDSPRPLLKFFAFFTRFRFRYFHYGDQGIFVRRSVFQQLNGFRDLPLMEDIDFLRRMHRVGRVALLKLPVTTSARRFLEHGILRQGLLDFILIILYRLGVNLETLAKWYYGTKSASR
jgi:rSAM/selenodomain-associated transferase 2